MIHLYKYYITIKFSFRKYFLLKQINAKYLFAIFDMAMKFLLSKGHSVASYEKRLIILRRCKCIYIYMAISSKMH